MTGTCDACGTPATDVERDHRIPKQWGGTDAEANLHLLCLTCHRRKSDLELRLTHGGLDRQRHNDWFALACPQPAETAVYVEGWADEGGITEEQYARILDLRREADEILDECRVAREQAQREEDEIIADAIAEAVRELTDEGVFVRRPH